MSYLLNSIKHSKMVLSCKNIFMKYMSKRNPVLATKILFRISQGYALNLEEPKTLNEKLQYLKLNDYYNNELVTKVVDKYRVREYIEEFGLSHLLNELHGKGFYKCVEDIDIQKLPEAFVLKCNHDSGSIIICKNKNEFNWEKEKKKLQTFLKKDYWLDNCECQYKDVEKGIICEKYLVDSENGGVTDYKFYCFNGEPKFLYLTRPHEENEQLQMCFYDLEWKPMYFRRMDTQELKQEIKKPENFQEMIDVAKKISKDFPFARIDLFNCNGQIYFSEITLIPTAGLGKYNVENVDLELGNMLKI